VAQQREAYLARLPASQSHAAASDPQSLERQLGELALKDLQAHPQERAKLAEEWKQSVTQEEWQRLKASPGYRDSFQTWFAGEQGQALGIPYDPATYLALRDAYPEGLATFAKVYQAQVAQKAESQPLLEQDFQRALETDLARTWWASSPAAAALREHLRQDSSQAAEAVAKRLEGGLQALIAVPAQIGTALLLTILITFDMARLKQGALGLRNTRIAGLYARIVPHLVALARLIGRSFAAQGLIAVFNTLLSFALFRTLGLDNELLVCSVVFIASFIPVLGIILSAIPIGLQALLQPDGALNLALYALFGVAVIHTIEATVLSPKIVGKVLHLHPVLVMAVLVIGERLFGMWGLLLGVPVAVYVIHAGVLGKAIPGVYEPAAPTAE
jgi:predicted PurR-regulated permease PerM